jgi:hypothetical protein
MADQEFPSSENPFASPPPVPPAHVPDAAVVQPQTTWPAVVGIIAIVLGSFGILGGCWGAVSTVFLADVMSEMIGEADPNSAMVFEQMQKHKAWFLVFSFGGGALAAWLLVTGIGILRRRSWAPSSAMCWAVAKMFLVVGQVVFNYQIQQEQFAAMNVGGNAPFDMGQFGRVIGLFSLAFGVIWGWALPVFLLIWFRRESIRAETEAWKTSG